jgi:hypothetical protein
MTPTTQPKATVELTEEELRELLALAGHVLSDQARIRVKYEEDEAPPAAWSAQRKLDRALAGLPVYR